MTSGSSDNHSVGNSDEASGCWGSKHRCNCLRDDSDQSVQSLPVFQMVVTADSSQNKISLSLLDAINLLKSLCIVPPAIISVFVDTCVRY